MSFSSAVSRESPSLCNGSPGTVTDHADSLIGPGLRSTAMRIATRQQRALVIMTFLRSLTCERRTIYQKMQTLQGRRYARLVQYIREHGGELPQNPIAEFADLPWPTNRQAILYRHGWTRHHHRPIPPPVAAPEETVLNEVSPPEVASPVIVCHNTDTTNRAGMHWKSMTTHWMRQWPAMAGSSIRGIHGQ
ncbi:hypothetical protein J8273_4131 [Carpediemonas membranifera]|uniref:Uncharacterized protein n=1 Tax=Carpediemonas membranifera TaxID=201153 RepID=A0A8J6E2L3_9EUKA|nr:hypothetical protein J8273_4131 [Carpediemonas membranifera]|eukprot:KAG9394466.1 hypothetical protein J8273_4131 [Carpediemonas membranifera]